MSLLLPIICLLFTQPLLNGVIYRAEPSTTIPASSNLILEVRSLNPLLPTVSPSSAAETTTSPSSPATAAAAGFSAASVIAGAQTPVSSMRFPYKFELTAANLKEGINPDSLVDQDLFVTAKCCPEGTGTSCSIEESVCASATGVAKVIPASVMADVAKAVRAGERRGGVGVGVGGEGGEEGGKPSSSANRAMADVDDSGFIKNFRAAASLKLG
jgi:hypothetical protein